MVVSTSGPDPYSDGYPRSSDVAERRRPGGSTNDEDRFEDADDLDDTDSRS
jgi:hypothetical protein